MNKCSGDIKRKVGYIIMSVKIINGKELYSMETVAEKFLFVKNRNEAREFIFYLQKQGLIERDTIHYEDRNEYKYHPTAWFAELIDGHWYAKDIILKGKKTNGTLYFDAFAAKALSRFAILSSKTTRKISVTNLITNALLSVALDDYVEKI